MVKNAVLLGIFLICFASCTDKTAYTSCKETLIEATQKILNTETLLDARLVDNQVNDTLYKYSRSKMSRDMIDEIKSLKSAYEKNKAERLEFLKATDTVPARRVVEMPGIGLVEIRTPPEV